MRDVMMEIYDALMSNEIINTHCADRIKFYLYPESGDKKKPFVIVTPTNVDGPSTFGSNKSLSTSYFYQLTVEATQRTVRDELAKEIQKVMNNLGFKRESGGLDTYFTETKRYVDTRSYSAIFMNEN